MSLERRTITTEERQGTMTPPAVLDPIDQIRKADADVEKRQRQLEKFAKRLLEEGSDNLANFATTARAWTTRFHERLPESLPPDAQNEIRSLLLNGVATLDDADLEARILDHIDALLVSLEAVRHVLRDAVDEDYGDQIKKADDAVRQLEEWLPAANRELLAKILGMSTRTVQRWLKAGGEINPRVRVVMQLIAILRRSWTQEGVLAWFFRPRSDLGGRQPIEALKNPEEYEVLLTLARQGRAGHGD
jgi:transcriptional regulator with XRE-family HTH domain